MYNQSLDLRPLQAPLFIARLHAAGVREGLFLENGPAPDEGDTSSEAQRRRVHDLAKLLQDGRTALLRGLQTRALLRAEEGGGAP